MPLQPEQMPAGMPPLPSMPPEGGMPPPMPPEGAPPMGMPQMPPEMPMEMPMESPVEQKSDGKTTELKKQVLQKLMNSLLNKPGRSLHELMNGIKDAMGAYKSYAKEVDALNGVAPAASSSGGAPSGGSSSEIQKILNGIQQKKAPADGAGGPGVQYQAPTIVPPSPQPAPMIAGPAQTSTFNRPAPINRMGIWGY